VAFDRDAIRALYHRRAGRYDRSLWLFRLAGFRFGRYRRSTVSSLGLDRGGTVVDLGCGTGLNFRLLEEAVGPTGTTVGIDLTDAMLDRARARVRSAGWKNVELVRADLAEYTPPEGIAGALSTFAITLVPEYDQVIAHCAAALCPGRLLAICDFKEPPGWPHWLVRLFAWFNRPFGVTLDLATRHPWESMRRYLDEVQYREQYFGALYLTVGERPDAHGVNC
jgi:demethylmenaquinone methyltransferase/2-methoxy-6-polyprenyl-1,4-benzoquinol methylase